MPYYMCPELRRKRMIPVLTHIRAKSVEEFGELVHHSGEEYIYVLEGAIEVHLHRLHAYLAAEGCEEAIVLGVCSSADEGLMQSLLTLHDEEGAAQQRRPHGKVVHVRTAPKRELRGKKVAGKKY